MQPADIEVIKEIPGYKVILKAVLKFQIQQLVGQLSEHTGEDSLLLTASVADGSLSHLGSESGKVFLDSHDDIKTQFLGFCLNRHHRQKQIEKEKEEEREREKERQSLLEASNRIMRVPTTPTRYGTGMRPRFTPTRMQVSPRQQQFSTRFQTSPRQSVVSPGQGRINSAPRMQSVPLSGTSPQGAQRVGLGNVRHEPYLQARPKRTSLNFNQQGRGPNPNSDVPQKQPTSTMRLPTEPQKNQKINIDPNEVIKIEAPDDEDDVEIVPEKTKPKQLENTIAKRPEVTGPPQTIAPKQPVRTITETAIKIASVTGASETNSEKSVTTDPVPSGAIQTSEIPEVSEAPTLSSVSSAPSVPDTPALAVPSNINMPVLSPIPQDETSNSSESTISNAPISVKVSDIAPAEGLSLASDLSKLTGIPAQNENVKMENEKSDNASTSSTASTLIAGISQEDDLGVDPTVSVKVEAVNQSGMGLEITGMTPEQMTQGQGASNVQNMMEVGPSTSGMTGMRDGVGNQMNPEYKNQTTEGTIKTENKQPLTKMTVTVQSMPVQTAGVASTPGTSNTLTVVTTTSGDASPNTMKKLKAQEKDAIQSWIDSQPIDALKADNSDDIIIVDDAVDSSGSAKKRRKVEQAFQLDSNKLVIQSGRGTPNNKVVVQQPVTVVRTLDKPVYTTIIDKPKAATIVDIKAEQDDIVLIDINDSKPLNVLQQQTSVKVQTQANTVRRTSAEKIAVQTTRPTIAVQTTRPATRTSSKGPPELIIDVDEVDGTSNAARNRAPQYVTQASVPSSSLTPPRRISTPDRPVAERRMPTLFPQPRPSGLEQYYYVSQQPGSATNPLSPPISPQAKFNQPPSASPMAPPHSASVSTMPLQHSIHSHSTAMSPPISPHQMGGAQGQIQLIPPMSPQQKQSLPKYNCGDCGKGFASNAALTQHHRTHTGDKPFECDVCGKKFSTKQSVKNHILKLHFKNPEEQQ